MPEDSRRTDEVPLCPSCGSEKVRRYAYGYVRFIDKEKKREFDQEFRHGWMHHVRPRLARVNWYTYLFRFFKRDRSSFIESVGSFRRSSISFQKVDEV